MVGQVAAQQRGQDAGGGRADEGEPGGSGGRVGDGDVGSRAGEQLPFVLGVQLMTVYFWSAPRTTVRLAAIPPEALGTMTGAQTRPALPRTHRHYGRAVTAIPETRPIQAKIKYAIPRSTASHAVDRG